MINNSYSRVLRFLTERKPLLLHATGVFLLSIAITILFWRYLPASFQQNDNSDYTTIYEPVARNILNGAGFFLTNGAPALNYPPGFPIILAGIFWLARALGLPESLVYSAFTLLCMGLSSMLIFLFSVQIWGIRGGWLSALFFMTYPFVLWLTKQPNSEIPYMVVFYASLYLFWLGMHKQKKPGWLLLISGILAGFAMLIRPIAVGMGLILFVILLIIDKKRPMILRFLLGLAILFGSFLAILPWEVWAYQNTGQLVLLSTGSVPSIRDGLTFAVESKNYRQNIVIPADVVHLQNEFVAENASMNSLGEVIGTVKKHLIQEPLTVIKLFLIKSARSWYGTDTGSMEPDIIAIQLVYILFILLATVFVWHNRSSIPGLLLFVWGFVFYFWLMTTMVLSILRYMVPVIGLLALLIPELVNVLLRRLSLTRPR